MVVAPNHFYLNWIFHHEPSIWGHVSIVPHIQKHTAVILIFPEKQLYCQKNHIYCPYLIIYPSYFHIFPGTYGLMGNIFSSCAVARRLRSLDGLQSSAPLEDLRRGVQQKRWGTRQFQGKVMGKQWEIRRKSTVSWKNMLKINGLKGNMQEHNSFESEHIGRALEHYEPKQQN